MFIGTDLTLKIERNVSRINSQQLGCYLFFGTAKKLRINDLPNYCRLEGESSAKFLIRSVKLLSNAKDGNSSN